MKKIILLAAIVVFVSGLTFGQTVSEDNFRKGVDYLNCKVVELSLSKTKAVDQFKNQCVCTEKPDFEKIKACIEQNEKMTLELSEEINQLKEKSYKFDLTPDAAIKFLGEDVFASNRKLDALTKELKPEDFNKLKYELKTEYKEFFEKAGSSANNEFWLNLTVLLALLTFLLLAAALILAHRFIYKDFGRSIERLKIQTEDIYKKLDRLKIPNNAAFAKPNPKETKPNSDETAKIKETVNKLVDEVNKLKKFKETVEMNSQQTRGNRPPTERKTSQHSSSRSDEDLYNRAAAVPPREIFYLSTPNEDGSFNVKSALTAFDESASIYRFTKINDKLAEFQIDENESACQQALNYPDVNIQRACTAQNSRSDGMRRIVTKEAGRAELDGDKWRIKDKAKIKYEH